MQNLTGLKGWGFAHTQCRFYFGAFGLWRSFGVHVSKLKKDRSHILRRLQRRQEVVTSSLHFR